MSQPQCSQTAPGIGAQLVHWLISVVLLACLWQVGGTALAAPEPAERAVVAATGEPPVVHAVSTSFGERLVDRRLDEPNEPVHALPVEVDETAPSLRRVARVVVGCAVRVRGAVSAHGPRAPPAD